MITKYKVILSGESIYRELELPSLAKYISVGTETDCMYRFSKQTFFEPIRLSFQYLDHGWVLSCSENYYIDLGDARKILILPLENGIAFSVKYQVTDVEAFRAEFLADFGNEQRHYEREIFVDGLTTISIGSSRDCNIVLMSDWSAGSSLYLSKDNGSICVTVMKDTFGVFLNGTRVYGKFPMRSGDFLFISDYVFYLSENSILSEIRNDMSINGLKYVDIPAPAGYPRFSRNTRLKLELNKEEIEILDPPSKPVKPKSNILTALLPSISMLLISGLMAFMGGTSMIIFSALSGVTAILTTILGITQGRKDFKTESEQRIEKYQKYTESKRAEIAESRTQERADLESIFPDQNVEKKMVFGFSSDLFDRLPCDEDFLMVRLGLGDILAERKINYKKHERLAVEDNLQLIPGQIYEEEKTLRNAPVVCALKEANAVGIIGSEDLRFAMMKNMVLDLCARQYQTDVKLCFIAESEHKNKLSWLRFLPHAYEETTGARYIVCDDDSRARTFDYLYKELSQRTEERNTPHLVVFFYDDCGIQSHPLSKYIDSGHKLGITFVFMAPTKADIPLGCSQLIELTSKTKGTLIQAANIGKHIDFNYQPIGDDDAKEVIQFLAPVFTEEISLEGTLTKNISLFEMLKILDVDDLDLNARWSHTDVTKSMAAPIGVSKAGLISLDLHDKAHGPHGLVAGTTGSGKSEALQTYILSIATLFHPYEISFVIIDFKGGGMVNQFRDLPHLLGAITNIDGKEIDRSLRSIKAELQKRQRLFAEADVNHIDRYIKKFKEGTVKTPVPHLVLIVDEFAELKAEQPDFMKELISAARIGRSLGVHLILATQKPSGQVDDQIWSNSRFKLCLKVQSQEDSNEVLKSPLAAEIKEPGRAYLQVGNNEIFELFQSAYSGAPAKLLDSTVKEFTLYSVDESGRKNPIFSRKKRNASGDIETQLDAVVHYVSSFCETKGITKLENICLPALSDRIVYPEYIDGDSYLTAIGIYDDPDNQYQGVAEIDISKKNTFIIGSSQYGKTNLLQSLIRSIVTTKTSAMANIYIIDFGSMVLKNFEPLQQVGGVVCSSEDEKLKNLFRLLFDEITMRKEKMVSVGVSSFASYVDAGYKDLPQIYLFIDNLTALIELYLQDDDSLLTLLREGVSVGISTIVANSQTSGVGYRYLTNFSNKIALFCNDSSEYNNFFDHVTLTPDEKPGRCVLEIDKSMMECQTYLAFTGEKEIDRVTEMQLLIERVNQKNNGIVKAKMIPYIPAVLDEKTLYGDYNVTHKSYELAVGLTYNGVEPFYMNLASLGLMGLCGKENTGHKNFIRNILQSLESVKDEYPSRVVIFDDISRKYADFKDLSVVSNYFLGTDGIASIISEWHSILESRYDSLLEDGTMGDSSELLLLVIQNNDVAKVIGNDMDLTEQFTDIVNRYKGMNIAVIFANYSNTSVSYDAPEPIRMIKQDQHLICFEDLDNLKPFEVSYDDIRANRKKLGIGDAYYIQDSSVIKLKLVKVTD